MTTTAMTPGGEGLPAPFFLCCKRPVGETRLSTLSRPEGPLLSLLTRSRDEGSHGGTPTACLNDVDIVPEEGSCPTVAIIGRGYSLPLSLLPHGFQMASQASSPVNIVFTRPTRKRSDPTTAVRTLRCSVQAEQCSSVCCIVS